MTFLLQEAKPTPGLQFPSVQYQSLPRPKAFSHGDPRYFSFGPCVFVLHSPYQGGRTWQPFVGGKNGHENFRQTHIYNLRKKCVVFARNCKFAYLTQCNMQYISYISALFCPKGTVIDTQKNTFFPKDLKNVCKSRQILILRQNSICWGYHPGQNFSSCQGS